MKEEIFDPRNFGGCPAPSFDEKMLSQIMEGSPIPTFIIDRQHNVTHCNRAYERLAGVTAEKIIGGSPSHRFSRRRLLADFIVDGAEEQEIADHYRGRYRRSEVIEGAFEAEEFLAATGEKGKWLFFTAAPITDAAGKIIGAIETLQDVTERKSAEEEVRRSEGKNRGDRTAKG